ncbi:MAG: WXG100 family type VII secretion target [Acidimicrobiales bacterium]
MSNNRVGFGEGTIKSTGQLLAGAKVELRRLSKELQGEIDQLQGKWGGAGAQAFGVLNRAWDEKQGAIVMTLEKFEATLDETEKSMTTSDEQSSASVAAIRNQMEGI